MVASLATAPARAATAPVTLGDDAFVGGAWKQLHGRCIGIVTDRSGRTAAGTFVVDAIAENKSICVKAVFVPEKGLRGDRAGSRAADYVDKATKFHVYSLAGPGPRPTRAMLSGIGAIVFDLQDLGVRDYPALPTLFRIMRTAAASGISLWILDRPNPIGGTLTEGPATSDAPFPGSSALPIPFRYAMTLGEIARMENSVLRLGIDLQVLPMNGWKRAMLWGETGLTWTPPAADLPFWETTLVYPATSTLPNAGLRIGLDTDAPYQYIGTLRPDTKKMLEPLNARAIPGVQFTALSWMTKHGARNRPLNHGMAIAISDPHAFESVRTAVEVLAEARAARIAPNFMAPAAFDAAWGTPTVRRQLTAAVPVDTIVAGWAAPIAAFKTIAKPYLLYP